MTPDHAHQTGTSKLGLENVGVGSQSLKVERGSLREDFKERREIRGRGGAEAEAEKTRRDEVSR